MSDGLKKRNSIKLFIAYSWYSSWNATQSLTIYVWSQYFKAFELSFNHISRLIIQYYNWVGLEFNKQENISVKEQSVFVWHVKQK